MIIKHAFRFKTLLIGLVAIKIGGTLFYLTGTVSFVDLFFSQPIAIAQEKAPDAPPEQAVQGKQPAPEKKQTAAGTDVSALMKRLDAERKRIQNEENRIKEQKAQLESLKAEIEEKIDTLSKIQQQIIADLDRKEALLSDKDQKQKAAEMAKIKMLSKVYASMKPKQAAAIIDKMDIDIIEKVFSQMKGEQVGSILAYVEKDRAAKISERLADGNTVAKK
jgi:flagellar motility protein MotE (MotC chaperone)